MQENELIPDLFRTEYKKIVAVLCKLFGIEHIEIAEDIASDTFLLASETWIFKGVPENPAAWLYTVSKNKARDYLKRNHLFQQKISKDLSKSSLDSEEIEIDLTEKNIADSQLQMMFAICDPCISTESQIGLSLRILCGFGIDQIADAFLSNKENINKRLFRARDKMRAEKVKIEFPQASELPQRLKTVLTTLYLLFNEGYYSSSQNITLRKDICLEAMRLTTLLINYPATNQPAVNALLSLMCFHASRFEARTNSNGDTILYHDQDEKLWNADLISRGVYFLKQAGSGNAASAYHLQAGIAYWHTFKTDAKKKWEGILQLYNQLLLLEYTPIAALNRTYALSKANGKGQAIAEAEKLQLTDNHLYHSLLGELYTDIDNAKAIACLETALQKAKSPGDKELLRKKISKISGGSRPDLR